LIDADDLSRALCGQQAGIATSTASGIKGYDSFARRQQRLHGARFGQSQRVPIHILLIGGSPTGIALKHSKLRGWGRPSSQQAA
jgi:hypothetical protein